MPYDHDQALELCPAPCPACNFSTRYTGWWAPSEKLGPLAKVICPNCEYVFFLGFDTPEPDDDWMLEEFDEEDEEGTG